MTSTSDLDFSALLGQVDVVFVVDTTSSMIPFIEAAREHIRKTVESIAANGDLDVQLALVEYRDHPPQEETFVTRIYPFADTATLQRTLESLTVHGGGDGPEAVLDGLVAAAKMQWRPDADRLCFLVGDAPPHGVGDPGDGFPTGCPCRATPNGVVELLCGNRVTLHAVLLSGSRYALSAFKEMAEATDGRFEHAEHAVAATHFTGHTLSATSDMIGASRTYMAASASIGTTDHKAVAEHLGWTSAMAEGTASYLTRRGALPKTDE